MSNNKMKSEEVKVLLLHEYPELLEECAELLNRQWKRSSSARVQSLEKCYKDLPDSLLLLEEKDGVRKIIGHSRLTRVLEDPNGCWIGSVVIALEERRKGYGKYLMQKTEQYAKHLQFSTAYLNTHDQQGFYEHLGYSYGNAVSSISFKWSGFTKAEFLINNQKDNEMQNQVLKLENKKSSKILENKTSSYSAQNASVPLPPPPPPLPPPLSSVKCNSQNKIRNLGQYWMKKTL